jgi:hypothetical protein
MKPKHWECSIRVVCGIFSVYFHSRIFTPNNSEWTGRAARRTAKWGHRGEGMETPLIVSLLFSKWRGVTLISASNRRIWPLLHLSHFSYGWIRSDLIRIYMYTLRLISEIGYKQCISYSYARRERKGQTFNICFFCHSSWTRKLRRRSCASDVLPLSIKDDASLFKFRCI